MGKHKVVTTTDSRGREITTAVNAREEAALRAAGRPVKVELDEQQCEDTAARLNRFLGR